VSLQLCIGNYEAFKKGNDLVNRFYSTDDAVRGGKIKADEEINRQTDFQ
jgi:hypothetical protein